MIEQLKTIRAALEEAHDESLDENHFECRQILKAQIAALTQLEAMAGEPVAWRTFDGEGGYDYRTYDENEDYADEWDKRNPNHKGWVEPLYTAAPVAQQYEAGDVASAAAQGFRDGVASVAQQPQKLEDIEQYRMRMAGICTAAIGYWKEGDPIHPDYDTPALRDVAKLYAKYAALYKAQQPQARPDFVDEWTGYLKDGETPFERFLRERKDMQSVLKLYQRVLEENERLKAQQPQAECRNDGRCQYAIDSGAEGLGHCPKGKCVMQQSHAKTAEVFHCKTCGCTMQMPHDDCLACERGAPQQAEAVPVVDRVYEAAKRLVDHADFQLGGVLSAKSKARDIPSNAASKVKARHLASLRDALAKTPQQAEAVPPGYVLVPLDVLEAAAESLGSFVSDHGWTDLDMQAMDNLDAILAQQKGVSHE